MQGLAQARYEREHRIKKRDFPEQAHALLANEIIMMKRLRFYKETDSAKTSYKAKFKKDKLHYNIEFNSEGILEDIEIEVKEIDLPNDSFTSIKNYLNRSVSKYNIRKIQQQYHVKNKEEIKKTLKEAFQNLLLPTVNYALIVSCKTEDGRVDYKYLFDSAGTFKEKRRLLPPNYDHILY